MAFLNEAGVSRLWQHILAKLNLKADKTDVETVANLVGEEAVSTQISNAVADSVKYTEQTLTNDEKLQARTNIGLKNIVDGSVSGAVKTSGAALASGYYSFAEGSSTRATGSSSHAEGSSSQANGSYSHAEGNNTRANENSSHAEGGNTEASADYSHVEGYNTKAQGEYSHAEGNASITTNIATHAEGQGAQAKGKYSHAEGYYTKAYRQSQHVEGEFNVPEELVFEQQTTSGYYQTGGLTSSVFVLSSTPTYTAGNNCFTYSGIFTQTPFSEVKNGTIFTDTTGVITTYYKALGTPYKYNVTSTIYQYRVSATVYSVKNLNDNKGEYVHITGNGTSSVPSNAHTLDWNGNAWYSGDVYVGSTSGTNKDEGSKKLATEEYADNIVYVGPEEPTNENTSVWIDTDANADTAEEWRTSLDVYSKAETDAAIENIQVGGRNLLRGTRDWDSTYWSYIGNQTVSGETVLVDAAGLGADEYKQTYQQIDLQAGKTYTLSVDLLEAQPGLVGVWATDNTQMKRHYAINLPAGTASESKRYSGTFTVPEGSARFVIYVQARNGGYIKVQRIQLEEGNKATAWSPSPEDIKKESRAYNLLDNSDFTNVINQRGLTHYTSGKYTVDRWQAMAGVTDVEVVNGGVKVTGSQTGGSHCWWGQPFEKALDANKTYTIYVERSDGNIYTAVRKPDNVIFALNNRVHARLGTNNLQLISLNGQEGTTYKYIALYEGAYTAETCPAYVPKGYAHELAECQKYYENSWYGGNKSRQSQVQGFVGSTNIDSYIFFKQPKRIVPTITFHPYGTYSHWAYFNGAYIEAASESAVMRDGNIGFMARLAPNSSSPVTTHYSYAVEGHWEASAEL